MSVLSVHRCHVPSLLERRRVVKRTMSESCSKSSGLPVLKPNEGCVPTKKGRQHTVPQTSIRATAATSPVTMCGSSDRAPDANPRRCPSHSEGTPCPSEALSSVGRPELTVSLSPTSSIRCVHRSRRWTYLAPPPAPYVGGTFGEQSSSADETEPCPS